MTMTDYADFLARKQRTWTGHALPVAELPPQLFDWQAAITRWAMRKGRAAIFADCGLGKTFMQLAWAQAVPGRVLILAPLCVAEQTVGEGAKLGIACVYARGHATAGEARIVITNYERLDKFDIAQFAGVVLDESSILKSFDGKTRTALIKAFAQTPYRLCCTATPSPNDIAELANHAEFLGLQTRAEFLATWFVHDDSGWRMKRHARHPFFRWLTSWAVAFRKPSDLGYSDDGFVLPPLTIKDYVIESASMPGVLFPELGSRGLSGRLAGRRGSLQQRCDAVQNIVGERGVSSLVWCGLNEESDRLGRELDGAVNVQGKDDYDVKVRALRLFVAGDIKVMISKLSILGFGLNLQHCARMVFCGLSDSYESYYQGIRRCWRFGQQRPVEVTIVVSDAERVVVENVRAKERNADAMATELLAAMRDFEREELSA
jgi:hypothetical protein